MNAAAPRAQRLQPLEPAVVAFGSNLGNRSATIRSAIDDLGATPGIRVDAVSPFIETAAVRVEGVDKDAPRYLNGVALVSTALDPHALLDELHRIEDDHGRVRAERWGDRTLDLDLIAMGDRTLADEDLILPHPRAAERQFVLAPWLAVDPDAELPGLGRVDALLAALRASARRARARGSAQSNRQGGMGTTQGDAS